MLDEIKRQEGFYYFQQGVALERVNRWKEAASAYREAIARDPYLREAHLALGFYYQRNGLLARAADEFHIAASLDTDFLTTFTLASTLMDLERYDDALSALHECLQIEPDDPTIHYDIASLYYLQQQTHDALAHLSHALRSEPNLWEAHLLIGKCYLLLQRYDDAAASFSQALALADTIDSQTDILSAMIMVERYREFPSLKNAKDSFYAQEGIVYLGSAQDNGLDLVQASSYHFTYADIAKTLQRLIALYTAGTWHVSAIVSVDQLSYPVARAIATLLHLPLCDLTEADGDAALLIMAIVHHGEMVQLAMERATCPLISFGLGCMWDSTQHALPDILGIVATEACSVPWEATFHRLRADGAPIAEREACLADATTQILTTMQHLPLDPNIAHQVRYYTRTHRRLRFFPHEGGW